MQKRSLQKRQEFLKYLCDDNFMFWLRIFHHIMPHVEVSYNQVQSREIGVFKVNQYITDFKTAM